MTVKEHYDNHLGNFYSWLVGDFDTNKNSFKTFCLKNGIQPQQTKRAIDLGAGNGIQTFALAELGFAVTAIDFNTQLIDELTTRIGITSVEVCNDDIKLVGKYSNRKPELIVCCGDTLPHLDSFAEIRQFLKDCFSALVPNGKMILTFRDYSIELEDTKRFIPVKSDSEKILTCFLEYSEKKVRVTDLLHARINGEWIQKVSSYEKVRIGCDTVTAYLQEAGFKILLNSTQRGMVSLVSQK
jgi:2-polyprenyl-3-methyl-5-hydroxy-6-metoxy-1,4-benzoquinol methylase